MMISLEESEDATGVGAQIELGSGVGAQKVDGQPGLARDAITEVEVEAEASAENPVTGYKRSGSLPFEIIADTDATDAERGDGGLSPYELHVPRPESFLVGPGEAHGACRSPNLPPPEIDEDFVQLQAVLAGLAMHAVPSRGPSLRHGVQLASCAGKRPEAANDMEIDEAACSARVLEAKNRCALDYPMFRYILEQLEIVYSCIDFTMLAHHSERHLFTVVRGTDRSVNPLTFPRDWGSNFSLLVGLGPRRHHENLTSYATTRSRFRGYTSYGSGHSLGGAIMVEMAKCVDKQAELRFQRVDVFNTAASPLVRTELLTYGTDLHVHRVLGDWASWGLLARPPPGLQLRSYESKAAINDKHALTHFLPDRAHQSLEQNPPYPTLLSRLRDCSSSYLSNCGGRQKKTMRPSEQLEISTEKEIQEQVESNPAQPEEQSTDTTFSSTATQATTKSSSSRAVESP